MVLCAILLLGRSWTKYKIKAYVLLFWCACTKASALHMVTVPVRSYHARTARLDWPLWQPGWAKQAKPVWPSSQLLGAGRQRGEPWPFSQIQPTVGFKSFSNF
jgi:hypothetical protein